MAKKSWISLERPNKLASSQHTVYKIYKHLQHIQNEINHISYRLTVWCCCYKNHRLLFRSLVLVIVFLFLFLFKGVI